MIIPTGRLAINKSHPYLTKKNSIPKYAVFFGCLRKRLINCQSPRWYYHLSYNITPRTDLDVNFLEELLENYLSVKKCGIWANASKNSEISIQKFIFYLSIKTPSESDYPCVLRPSLRRKSTSACRPRKARCC